MQDYESWAKGESETKEQRKTTQVVGYLGGVLPKPVGITDNEIADIASRFRNSVK